VDQVEAPSALVGVTGAFARGHAADLVPDLGDQDSIADEQPDQDHGNPPAEAGRTPIGASRRIDRVCG
jgi:hypothetical protein